MEPTKSNIQSDILPHISSEEAIKKIVDATSHKSGNLYFNSLVKILAEIFHADRVWIGRLANGGDEELIRSMAHWHLGETVPNIDYAVKQSPCELVLNEKQLTIIGQDVRLSFPNDKKLQGSTAESYLGIPLFASNMNLLGVIGCFFNRRISHRHINDSMIQLVANHAATEIERLDILRSLVETNEVLRESEMIQKTKNSELLLLNNEFASLNREYIARNQELKRALKELEHSNEELRRSESSLLRIQRIARIGNCRYDYPSERLYLSAMSRDLLGFNKDYVTRDMLQLAFRYVHEEDKVRVSERMHDLMSLNSEDADKINDLDRLDFRIHIDDCVSRFLRCEFQVLKDKNGHPFEFLGTVQDITDLKEVQLEYLKAKDQAEEADRVKSAFLANMSHQIRTPVNGILGFTELYFDAQLSDATRRQYFDLISSSCNQLTRIIDDIIDITRIEAAQIKLHETIVMVNEVLRESIAFYQPIANKKGLEIELHKSLSDQNSFIETDGVKLRQILAQLIDNALKFTHEGGVKIGCKKDGDYLVFSVQDSGIGIEIHNIDRIFKRFQQVANEGVAHRGAGLGLAIVSAYVDLMGGTIWVESQPGEGSSFLFTIPYNRPKDLELMLENSMNNRLAPTCSVPKVLVVEDEEINFLYLEQLISRYDVEILHACDGLQAVEMATENPDLSLILMDIKLPGINGLEATRQIKDKNSEIPIVAQTAYAMMGDRDRVLQAGCDGYVPKPMSRSQIINVLKKYIPSIFSVSS